MIIYWNHTTASLHYSKYYHQRLEMGGPTVWDPGPLRSTKIESFTYFLTLMWRQTQCGQKFWNLTAPLPWRPRGSPDVSKVAGAVAEAAAVSGWECSVQTRTNPTRLVWIPSLVCSPTPAQLSCSWCPGHRHTTGVPSPTDCQVTSISLPRGAKKPKSNHLNSRTRN